MNHFYTMSGFPKPRGHALTLLALEYNIHRRWWAGERLPLVGDRAFDRRICRVLVGRVFGRRSKWLDLKWLTAGIAVGVMLGLWALAFYAEYKHAPSRARHNTSVELDGGVR